MNDDELNEAIAKARGWVYGVGPELPEWWHVPEAEADGFGNGWPFADAAFTTNAAQGLALFAELPGEVALRRDVLGNYWCAWHEMGESDRGPECDTATEAIARAWAQYKGIAP